MNPRVDAAARARGAVVGSFAGATSIAAHGLACGTAFPSQGAVVLLVLACAATGTAAASFRSGRMPLLLLAAVLAAGQGIGHLTLTLASQHGHGLHLTAQMLAAHTSATLGGALLTRAAEWAIVVILGSLLGIAVALAPTVPVAEFRTWTPIRALRLDPTTDRVARSVGGTRGPPALSR